MNRKQRYQLTKERRTTMTDKPNLTEIDLIDLSEKNNCDVCNKKDKLQKRNNKWYCPKCYLSEVTK